MKIIKGPTVTQVRIYPQDTIPYTDLAIRKKFDQFREKFSFSRMEIPSSFYEPGAPKIINLSGGSITIDNETILINSLNFEERKIVLIIEASSDKADKAFDIIGEELKSIDRYKNFSSSSYLIKTEETECTVQLNIDYYRFFSRQFNSFIKRTVVRSPKQPARKISLKNLSFEISFKQDKMLEDVRILMVPKLFTIEPRLGTREEERVFFTRSPNDSETHLKLLSELEILFAKG